MPKTTVTETTLPPEVEALQREADRLFECWVKAEDIAEAAHEKWERAERAATAALSRLA